MSDEYPGGHGEPPRSPKWPKVEKEVLGENPRCACCVVGQVPAAKHQVHHVIPFHYAIALGRADLELDKRNLIVLCETTHNDPAPNHHLLAGHGGDFKSDNIHVRDDVVCFMGMSAAEIQADPRFLARKAARLKPLDQMTDEEKAALRALMDALYPLGAAP